MFDFYSTNYEKYPPIQPNFGSVTVFPNEVLKVYEREIVSNSLTSLKSLYLQHGKSTHLRSKCFC